MSPQVAVALLALLTLAPVAEGRAAKVARAAVSHGSLRSAVVRPIVHETPSAAGVASPSVNATAVEGHHQTGGHGKPVLLQQVSQPKLSAQLPRPEYDLLRLVPAFQVFFCIATGAAILFVLVLMGCCICDGIKYWQHMAYFRHCYEYVQRVHDTFSAKPHCAKQLCPCCIEQVSCEHGSNSVVFLCGHFFHMECANRWYLDRQKKGQRCPICNVCEEGDIFADTCPPCGDEDEEETRRNPAEEDLERREETGTQFDTKAFFLRSLQERFPEFITQDCVRRWAGCHTEIWLSELDCPRYPSMFASVLARTNSIIRRK